MSTGEPTQATRRELNPRQAGTVERVLAAAREELREVGFDDLTVRSVAHRAGVAPATAYTYFSSKNHLVAEIFWRRLNQRPRLEETLTTPLARVVEVFNDLADLLASEQELAAATTSAMLATEPDVRQLRLLIGNEINARIAAALGDRARRCARRPDHRLVGGDAAGRPGARGVRDARCPDGPLRQTCRRGAPVTATPRYNPGRSLGEKDLAFAVELGDRLGVDTPLADLALTRLGPGLGVA